MSDKKEEPIITDPFGSYTGVVRFPDATNPRRRAPVSFPQKTNPAGNRTHFRFPEGVNPGKDARGFQFPQADNPVQDADDL